MIKLYQNTVQSIDKLYFYKSRYIPKAWKMKCFSNKIRTGNLLLRRKTVNLKVFIFMQRTVYTCIYLLKAWIKWVCDKGVLNWWTTLDVLQYSNFWNIWLKGFQEIFLVGGKFCTAWLMISIWFNKKASSCGIWEILSFSDNVCFNVTKWFTVWVR